MMKTPRSQNVITWKSLQPYSIQHMEIIATLHETYGPYSISYVFNLKGELDSRYINLVEDTLAHVFITL